MGILFSLFSTPEESPVTKGYYERAGTFVTTLIGKRHTQLHPVLLAFLFFSVLFVIVNFAIVSVTRFRRKLLTMEMELVWTQTIVHLVFSLIAAPLSVWYLLFEPSLSSDIANSVTTQSVLLMCIMIGFMACEVATLLASNYILRFFNRSIFCQDVVMIFGACLLLHYNQAHFFGLMGIALEAVYVFSSLSWIAKQNGALFGSNTWRFFHIVTIHMCNYCPLLGIYSLILSYRQIDSLLANLSVLALVVLYACMMLEFFFVFPSWSMKLMEDLQRVKVVRIPSGVYRLCSVGLAQVPNKRHLTNSMYLNY